MKLFTFTTRCVPGPLQQAQPIQFGSVHHSCCTTNHRTVNQSKQHMPCKSYSGLQCIFMAVCLNNSLDAHLAEMTLGCAAATLTVALCGSTRTLVELRRLLLESVCRRLNPVLAVIRVCTDESCPERAALVKFMAVQRVINHKRLIPNSYWVSTAEVMVI